MVELAVNRCSLVQPEIGLWDLAESSVQAPGTKLGTRINRSSDSLTELKCPLGILKQVGSLWSRFFGAETSLKALQAIRNNYIHIYINIYMYSIFVRKYKNMQSATAAHIRMSTDLQSGFQLERNFLPYWLPLVHVIWHREYLTDLGFYVYELRVTSPWRSPLGTHLMTLRSSTGFSLGILRGT